MRKKAEKRIGFSACFLRKEDAMTLQEALDIVDEMKPNMMSRKLKLKYLTEIEQLIFDEIVSKHYPKGWTPPRTIRPAEDPMDRQEEEAAEEQEKPEKPVYNEQSDDGTVMIVPDPYSMVYIYWVMSKIDIQNQEDARYNIDRAHFENAYNTMSDWWTREHMPVQKTREFRL